MTPDQRAPVEREKVELSLLGEQAIAEIVANYQIGVGLDFEAAWEDAHGIAQAILSALPASAAEEGKSITAFLDAIKRAAPNGEEVSVKYHANGDWSVFDRTPTPAPDVSEERAREVLYHVAGITNAISADTAVAAMLAFAAQPATVGEGVSAVDAFEMGYAWRGMLSGQTLEDSRAVGRTLGAQTFEPIADAISREEKRLGFNPFQSADLGICEAKAIIRAALALPATSLSPVAAQGVPSVREAGEALTPAQWRAALACGDHRDRFPCAQCDAAGPSGCKSSLSRTETDAARDFINGYGWAAAQKLASPPSSPVDGEEGNG